MLACKAFFEGWVLDEKFKIIASRLRAEPLGWCPLAPKIEYPIEILKGSRKKLCKSLSF